MSRVIRAPPEALYAAFLDPTSLTDWLPPDEMTGKIHAFDGRVGGGYRMSLFYPEGEQNARGKTAEAFIETGIRRLGNGFLALLLPAEFDSAVTRRRFFDECPAFTAKIILTRRVKWFENPANPKINPKENSAWFLWEGAILRARRPPIVL